MRAREKWARGAGAGGGSESSIAARGIEKLISAAGGRLFRIVSDARLPGGCLPVRDWVSPFFMGFRAPVLPSLPLTTFIFFFSFLILPFSTSHRVTMRPGEDKQRGEGVKGSGKRCIDDSFGFLVCESSRGTGSERWGENGL